jgi:hypothetical protein
MLLDIKEMDDRKSVKRQIDLVLEKIEIASKMA